MLLPLTELDRYRLEGRVVPVPYRARGLIDTAAERSCVSETVVGALLLQRTSRQPLATASGSTKSGIYDLMLHLGHGSDDPPDPIRVTAYDADVTGAEVLVGLDVLRHGRFVLRGPEGQFELFLPRTAHSAP